MRLSLVILCYNERVGLEALLDRIPRDAVEEILAVDGGSRDGSVELLRAAGIPIHGQSERGRGEAFRVAFQEAKGDALVFFSPDGNEDPRDIPRFREYLERGCDMVIANRMSGGGRNEEDDRWLRWRKWANLAFTLMANVTWNRGGWVADTINGYRAISRSAWERMRASSSGYTIEYECSIRAFKHGLKVAEFATSEGARLDGREGSPSLATGIAFLKLYARELFHR